ncbi:anti-sigma factor [Anthocerotibacter panamensis]|uniref:anti-sigma factor n=1 Tax=Anthocerotibacter panamensis TaxID=2857077 RepID=UPI001C402F0F|nr:anti-sigma factor [Anthocerotibacter panamensis]
MDVQPPTPEEERIADYLLGQMSPQERTAFEQWLLHHPQWQPVFEQYRAVLVQLPEVFSEEIQPPARLRQQLLQASVRQAPLSGKFWLWGSTAAAAVLILFLGVNNYRLQHKLTALEFQLAQSRKEMALLRQSDLQQIQLVATSTKVPASGFVLLSSSSTQVLLQVEHLPAAPSGKVYRLWAIVNGKRENCGQFTPERNGHVFMLLPADANLHKATLEVTLESEYAPEAVGAAILSSHT